MRVRLLRSWTNTLGIKYPVGKLIDTDRTLGRQLISERYAVEDNPKNPRKKIKSDFFKPK